MEEGDLLLDLEMEDVSLEKDIRKKGAKLIGLDDLLVDHYQEKSKIIERESKRARICSPDSSDDDDDDLLGRKEENQLSEFVNECEKQVHKIAAMVDVAPWGLRIFGFQKSPPKPIVPEVDGFPLLQSLSQNEEIESMIGLTTENGESFMIGILTNGWLLNLVIACGHCDEFTIRWAFSLMAYSPNESVEMSACNFLCSILSGSEPGSCLCALDWVPSYDQITDIVQTYGYLEDCMADEELLSEAEENEGARTDGPPNNIGSWVKFVAACCQARIEPNRT